MTTGFVTGHVYRICAVCRCDHGFCKLPPDLYLYRFCKLAPDLYLYRFCKLAPDLYLYGFCKLAPDLYLYRFCKRAFVPDGDRFSSTIYTSTGFVSGHLYRMETDSLLRHNKPGKRAFVLDLYIYRFYKQAFVPDLYLYRSYKWAFLPVTLWLRVL